MKRKVLQEHRLKDYVVPWKETIKNRTIKAGEDSGSIGKSSMAGRVIVVPPKRPA